MMEYLMDHVASQIGMDPDELRMRNLLKNGDPLVNGKPFNNDNPTQVTFTRARIASCAINGPLNQSSV